MVEIQKPKVYSFRASKEEVNVIDKILEAYLEKNPEASQSDAIKAIVLKSAFVSSIQSASGLQPSLAESSLGSKETVSKTSTEPLRPSVTEKGGDESYTVPLAETNLIDEIVELEIENKPMTTTWCPYGTIIKEAERLYKIHCSNPKEPTSSWLPKDRLINPLVCHNCGDRRQAVRDRRQKPSIVKEGSVIKWKCLKNGMMTQLPNKKCDSCQKQDYPRYLACQELQREYGLHSEPPKQKEV